MLKEGAHKACHMRMLVLAMLLSATFAPVVLAEAKWEEDGWLATEGLQKLADGDEFGCYGMPHLEWSIDPGAVALECREYIEERIDASKWGSSPISTFTPNGLTANQHTIIAQQGFAVHGDNTGQSATAWHSADDVPEWEYDWYDLGRRGGSLEKEIADIDALEQELDAGGLVNLYWIGRVNDATIRHDSEVFDMLHERDDIWFTTWGEAYSYWTVERCNEFIHNMNDSVLSFRHTDTVACNSAAPRAWNVPVTWIIEIPNSTVVSSSLPEMSVEDSATSEGWRQEGDILYVSVLRGHLVEFNLSEDTDYDVLGRTQFFNNKSTAVTIAAHSTTDLFRWSMRFNDNEDLRFTWLISPKAIDEGIAWLPYAGLAVLATTVSAIFLILRKEVRSQSRAEALMRVDDRGADDE